MIFIFGLIKNEFFYLIYNRKNNKAYYKKISFTDGEEVVI